MQTDAEGGASPLGVPRSVVPFLAELVELERLAVAGEVESGYSSPILPSWQAYCSDRSRDSPKFRQ